MPLWQCGGYKESLAELDVLVGKFNTYSAPTQWNGTMITYHQPCLAVGWILHGEEARITSS